MVIPLFILSLGRRRFRGLLVHSILNLHVRKKNARIIPPFEINVKTSGVQLPPGLEDPMEEQRREPDRVGDWDPRTGPGAS